MDNEGFKDLALAIVTQMVKDYYVCLMHIEKNDFITPRKKIETVKAVHDYERFFKSDRFHLYTDVSGESIIRVVRQRVKTEYEKEINNGKKEQ